MKSPVGPGFLNTPGGPGTLWSSLPTINLGTPGGLRNPFGPVMLEDPATSKGPGKNEGEGTPGNPWGPRISGYLETFGSPISPS
jgi:hypothetical protein